MNQIKKLKLLVVDDSKNLRQIIKRYISTNYDVEFFEAENGEIAEAVLQEQSLMGENIDIIFLDWMMPKVSGFEFLKKIRSTEQFKDKPNIIMLTAETYSEQMSAVLKYNVTAYLTKPFTAEDLCFAVDKCVANKELKHAV